MNSFAKTALCLAILATAAHLAAAWGPDWTITTQGNMAVDSCSTCLHYTCPGLDRRNSWAKVFITPAQPAAGMSTMFYIDVTTIEGTSEVKFTVLSDAILRWTNGGTVATWVYWAPGFRTIGASKILPGSGKHAVTVVRGVDSFSVFEDGVLIGTVNKPKDEVVPTYHMQALDIGAVLDIEVSDIELMAGINEPTAAAT